METTFYSFQSNIRYFLSQLLKNPIEAKPNSFLTDRGFNKKKLINILLKRDVITRHEKIKDDNDDITYNVKYNIKRKNFEKKLKRIYSKYFEKNEIDETTTCGLSSGAFVGPLNQTVMRKKIQESIENKRKKRIFITEKQYEMLKEALTLQNVGDIQYDVPFPVKKNDPTLKREKGLSVKRIK